MKKILIVILMALGTFISCSKEVSNDENQLLEKTMRFSQGDWYMNLYEDGTIIWGNSIDNNNNRGFAKYKLDEEDLTIEWYPGIVDKIKVNVNGDRFSTNNWGGGRLVEREELPPLKEAAERVFEVEDGIFASKSIIDDEISSFISNMSLEEKIGQMLTIGIWGDENLEPEYEQFIRDKSIGGVIIYSRNVLSHNHIIDLINGLKEENAKNSNIPLIVATDNEGAYKIQYPRNIANGLGNSVIADKIKSEQNFEIGRVNGEFLSDIGVNMNYGTMADVDFEDGTVGMMAYRAYGSDPDVVADYAIKYSEGNKEEGVVPVYKHFPGHGKSVDDSHYTLPVLKLTEEEWRDELLPFQIAIEQGSMEAVMTAHIVLENIDKDNPATLSKKILTDVLREEMGFDGVIITDDMEMNAIKEYYPFDEAVIRTVEAGTDIVLVCHTLKNQRIAQQALVDAVASGRLTEERIDESVFRILKLKKSNDYMDKTNAHIDVSEYNEKLTSFYTDLGILN